MAIQVIGSGVYNPPGSDLLIRRLPEGLFSALGSTNRNIYWYLICKLLNERFGANAPVQPLHGYSSREIIEDIEQEVTLIETWKQELDVPASDVSFKPNQRANDIFQRLKECGWLQITQHGAQNMVTMRREVIALANLLIGFAQSEPVRVSGKMHSIKLNLDSILNSDSTDADRAGEVLTEAAQQSRALLEHIRNTSIDIHDIMAPLRGDVITSTYVTRFFNEFIETKFIGDYKELHSSNHPLKQLPRILEMIEHIRVDRTYRSMLVKWYADHYCKGNEEKAINLFERDMAKLQELNNIPEYLDRLDREVRTINRKALTYLQYKLKAPQQLDKLINKVAASILQHHESIWADGNTPEQWIQTSFSPNELMSGDRLATPRKTREKVIPTALRKTELSETAIAKNRLLKRAKEERAVTDADIGNFLRKNLDAKQTVASTELPLMGIKDILIYQQLFKLSMVSSSNSASLQTMKKSKTHGFNVRQTSTQEEHGVFVSGAPFIIESTTPFVHKKQNEAS